MYTVLYKFDFSIFLITPLINTDDATRRWLILFLGGSSFVHTNDLPGIQVHKGDTVYYWLHAQKGGTPSELLGQSVVIGGNTYCGFSNKPNPILLILPLETSIAVEMH